MEDSSTQNTDLFPKQPHSAIICGQTGCGKTVFILELIKKHYTNIFDYIFIICPTLKWNRTYRECSWVKEDENVFLIDDGDKLQSHLTLLYHYFQGHQTLYIIDDCSDQKNFKKKQDMLSKLAFSGRHANQSVWVLTQKYNSVLTDLRENTKWMALFHCKDRDSFEECLRENDVVPKEHKNKIRQQLSTQKHAKLILKTDQPSAYMVLTADQP